MAPPDSADAFFCTVRSADTNRRKTGLMCFASGSPAGSGQGRGGLPPAPAVLDLLPSLLISTCTSLPSDPELPARSFPAAALERGQGGAAPSPPCEAARDASPKTSGKRMDLQGKSKHPRSDSELHPLGVGEGLKIIFLSKENHEWDWRWRNHPWRWDLLQALLGFPSVSTPGVLSRCHRG